MNIEKIKKELKKTSYCISFGLRVCNLYQIFSILDKYNNQPDYKSAFEQIKKMQIGEFANGEPVNLCDIEEFIEIEQKYNLDKEVE
jgi:hypothetical protein